MTAKTNTVCNDCIHKNVCYRLGRPEKIIEALSNFDHEDDNGMDIVVSCKDFRENATVKFK